MSDSLSESLSTAARRCPPPEDSHLHHRAGLPHPSSHHLHLTVPFTPTPLQPPRHPQEPGGGALLLRARLPARHQPDRQPSEFNFESTRTKETLGDGSVLCSYYLLSSCSPSVPSDELHHHHSSNNNFLQLLCKKQEKNDIASDGNNTLWICIRFRHTTVNTFHCSMVKPDAAQTYLWGLLY